VFFLATKFALEIGISLMWLNYMHRLITKFTYWLFCSAFAQLTATTSSIIIIMMTKEENNNPNFFIHFNLILFYSDNWAIVKN
jgi:hypothetical protein